VAETPGPKWEGGGHTGSFLSYGLSLIRSASSRQLRVARTSLMAELGNSNAVYPTGVGRDNASVRTGGRRRRRSPRLGWNGQDMVKLCQGKPVKKEVTDAERKADDGPPRLVHLSVSNGESALQESEGPTGKRSARKRACSVWRGGKAAKPYLSLP
jgi:hypothetical protein